MTREEVISEWTFRSNHIKKWLDEYGEEPSIRHYVELIDMAIEALTEPKTIIGIDIPYGCDKGIATIFKGNEKMVLEEVKEIMAVVRCKDCKHRDLFSCPLTDNDFQKDEDFCSWGERREK